MTSKPGIKLKNVFTPLMVKLEWSNFSFLLILNVNLILTLTSFGLIYQSSIPFSYTYTSLLTFLFYVVIFKITTDKLNSLSDNSRVMFETSAFSGYNDLKKNYYFWYFFPIVSTVLYMFTLGVANSYIQDMFQTSYASLMLILSYLSYFISPNIVRYLRV